MEIERSAAGDLPMLPRPHVSKPMSRSGRGGLVAVGSRQPSPSVLSAAVPEMLMVQRGMVAKKPRGPRLPPGGGSSSSSERRRATATAGADPAERAANAVLSAARMRQALAKRVARCMLKRGAPSPDGRRKVLACCCLRLPPGLRCALHQGATDRSWMRDAGGSAGEAVAPRACGRGGWAFSEYARWRRSVWMPSRFYLERVGVNHKDQGVVCGP